MNNFTILQTVNTGWVALIIFILIITFYLFGYRVRVFYNDRNPGFADRALGTINPTLVGMLGLLLAFTFSMSSSRYDSRRNIVIEEANDIGTAVLRADLYPDSLRNLLRQNFKHYIEERILFYTVGNNLDLALHHFMKADSIGKVIWNIATTDAKANNSIIRTAQMIPSLNAMIDVTTTRRALGESTVPDSIMYFLFLLCFCASFLLGYDNQIGKIDWILVLGLAVMLSFTVYTIIDLDRSRSGLIRLDVQNQKIIELLDMFK